MSKNLTITIVGVAIASIGLIFVLTSPQGTTLPSELENKVYEEWEVILTNGCIDSFPNHSYESEQDCLNFVKQCLDKFSHSTSIGDCFKINALHGPRP